MKNEIVKGEAMHINSKVDEADISRAIIEEYMKELYDYTECDVIVVGSGPSGSVAAKILAENGLKTAIFERNLKPGGGMYVGGMLMNKLVVESPAEKILKDAGVNSLKEYKKGLYVCDAVEAGIKLIAEAIDAGAKVFNAIETVDVIYRKTGICGIVANWHAVSALPKFITCVDPLCFKSKMVIDATGHAAEVARVASEKIGFKFVGREGSMWVEEAEKATLKHTKEIYPGLIVCGMAANSAYGAPRMGPIFGAMFLSGQKAAQLTIQKLKKQKKK